MLRYCALWNEAAFKLSVAIVFYSDSMFEALVKRSVTEHIFVIALS